MAISGDLELAMIMSVYAEAKLARMRPGELDEPWSILFNAGWDELSIRVWLVVPCSFLNRVTPLDAWRCGHRDDVVNAALEEANR